MIERIIRWWTSKACRRKMARRKSLRAELTEESQTMARLADQVAAETSDTVREIRLSRAGTTRRNPCAPLKPRSGALT